jgi:four helix bundle protein
VGSLFELQPQIEIALNLNYISKNIFEQIFEKTKELDRMLLALIKKIN